MSDLKKVKCFGVCIVDPADNGLEERRLLKVTAFTFAEDADEAVRRVRRFYTAPNDLQPSDELIALDAFHQTCHELSHATGDTVEAALARFARIEAAFAARKALSRRKRRQSKPVVTVTKEVTDPFKVRKTHKRKKMQPAVYTKPGVNDVLAVGAATKASELMKDKDITAILVAMLEKLAPKAPTTAPEALAADAREAPRKPGRPKKRA